jgi:hypothetical protein
MGLNFNHLLYYKREHLWDALQDVMKIADPYDPPSTTIHFPDHDLILPIATGFQEENKSQQDMPEFNFALSLRFEEDEAILDYLIKNGDKGAHRARPDVNGIEQIAIGFIYLTIYADLSKHFAFKKPTDRVLFDFGTTGTRMSLLFDESTSIRDTFRELAQKYHSVCAVFNRESGGNVFWLNEHGIPDKMIDDPYILPEEIATLLGE